jgi:hypothetical protein
MIGSELVRVLGRVARDAVADSWGGALPLSPADLLGDRAGLSSLLTPTELLGRPTDVWPRELVLTDQFAPSSNCQNSAIRIVRGRDDDGGASTASVFVKQPAADLATRVFANLIGFWKIECAFCRNLADRMPIDTPRIHAVRESASRFLIVMENLIDRPGIQLHVNREMLKGVSVEDARRCLDALARLHAGFAHLDDDERERALPRALHPHRSPSLRPIVLAVNRQAGPRCHRKAPHVFTAELLALFQSALEGWDAMDAAWNATAPTLVHGDSHWGNFFETDAGIGMLDFQGAHFGAGMRDVQYFLGNSMAPEVLEAEERSLVEYYAKRVSELGAPIGFETAWEQYRGFSFQTLMMTVVSLGLGSFTDSDEVMRVLLERACIAVKRLDFEGWLADLPR